MEGATSGWVTLPSPVPKALYPVPCPQASVGTAQPSPASHFPTRSTPWHGDGTSMYSVPAGAVQPEASVSASAGFTEWEKGLGLEARGHVNTSLREARDLLAPKGTGDGGLGVKQSVGLASWPSRVIRHVAPGSVSSGVPVPLWGHGGVPEVAAEGALGHLGSRVYPSPDRSRLLCARRGPSVQGSRSWDRQTRQPPDFPRSRLATGFSVFVCRKKQGVPSLLPL